MHYEQLVSTARDKKRNKRTRSKIGIIMDMLSLVYTVGIVIGGIFLAWLYTKPGKKWLDDL